MIDRFRRTIGLLICLATGLLAMSCASSRSAAPAATSAPANHGHLVIVGGGLADENAPVFQKFVSLCTEGPIGIIPIASGDGLEAGASSAGRWRNFSGEKSVVVIPLTKDSLAEADDAAIAEQIASCGGLWFTGGDQSRVTAVMRPDRRRTAALDACFKVLDRGGVIGGTSAGAALMSDPMITGGQSRGRTTRNPDETESEVRVGQGLGFLAGALTDQHFLQRGRLGRLIDALNLTGQKIGLGVSENSALIVHRESGECEVIGDRGVCVLSHPESSGPAAQARLAVLSTGDRLNLGTARIEPAKDRLPSEKFNGRGPGSFFDRITVRDPWDVKSWTSAVDRFVFTTGQIVRENDRIRVILIGDDRTRVWVDPAGKRPLCAADLLVRVEPVPQK